jgi:ribosomal protein S18 acetylase RimI-like enzyme
VKIRRAKPQDLHEVMDLIRSCVRHMESQGIYQWDEIYPDESTCVNDIERHELSLLEKDSRICGIMALNEFQELAYQTVKWQFSGKVLVVHRLAIDPAFHGNGFARQLMQFAYECARKRQYVGIRLDAFAYNPRAVALYERLGYHKADTVMFRKGLFFCFEIQVV